MTDKDKLLELFSHFGLTEYDTFTDENGDMTLYFDQSMSKVKGYIGFYTYFTFNAEGEFVCMGAGEK